MANKVTIDGYTFDSGDEAKYYEALKIRRAKGEIAGFEARLDPITLIPEFKDNGGRKVLAMTYKPDFRVYHNDGTEEIIEVKGFMEEDAGLKIKLYRYLNRDSPVRFTIVSRHITHAATAGDEHGFIEYEVLNKIKSKIKRAENKAKKAREAEFPGIIPVEKKKKPTKGSRKR